MNLTRTAHNPHINYVNRRGIQTSHIELGWTPAQFFDGSVGFCIPISDNEHTRDRFRALKTTSDNAKTKWFGKKGSPTPRLYMPPNLMESIRERDGHIIIASGEIDLATFYEIGWRNVIAFTSEGSVPQDLAERLLALGVNCVHYWHDNDGAGRKSAEKVRDRLLNSGIVYNAYTLENLVPERGDTNDLWQALNFNREAFIQALESAPLSILTPAQDKRRTTHTDFTRLQDDLLADVTNHLRSQPRARISGNNLTCCSPLREERNPSFSFDIRHGVWYDFGIGEGGSLLQLADRLGISSRYHTDHYKTQRDYLQNKSAPTIKYHFHPIDLRLMQGDEVINARYITPQRFTHRTIALKSALNTGKTQAIIRHILNNPLKRVLFVTHLKSLTTNTTQRLREAGIDATLYSEADDATLQRANVIVCTLNSLHRLQQTPPFDLIVFDEITQGIQHLFGKTLRGERFQHANDNLERQLKRAGQVIALDAHMTEYICQWLEHLRGDVHRLENTYRHQWGTCEIYAHESALITHIDQAIAENQGTVVVTVDSRLQSEALAQRYQRHYGASAVMLVHGHNNHEPDVRHFIQNINTEITRYRVVITSPLIGTGIDIQAPVYAVFGSFMSGHLKPNDALQQIARYRNAQRRGIALSRRQRHFETSAQTLHEQALQRANITRQKLNIAHSEENTTASKLWAKAEAHANYQKNVFWHYFCQLASKEGFQLSFDYAEIESIQESIKDERTQLIQTHDALRLQLTGMTSDEFRQRQRDDSLKREDYFRLERWRIERTTGRHLTPELLKRYKLPRQQRALIHFTDYMQNQQQAQWTDLEQLESPIHQRQHRTVQQELFDTCVKTIFDSLDNTDYLHAEELETRAQHFIEENLGMIQRFIDGRYDLSQKPIAIIRRILRYFGINLETKTNNQVKEGEPRRQLYRISPDTVRQMRQDARCRLRFITELKAHTKHDTDKDYSRFLCGRAGQTPKIPRASLHRLTNHARP